jgi:hypothetical protein
MLTSRRLPGRDPSSALGSPLWLGPGSTFASLPSSTMSFQGLVSASECGTSANPLAQVLKHTDGDRSLQQVSQLD